MRTLLAVATAASLVAAGSVSAAGLNGQTIQIDWIYAPTGFQSTRTVVAGPGNELSGSWESGATVDLADASVYVGFLDPSIDVSGLASGTGWRFSGDFNQFTGLTATTNFVGWNDSWSTLTASALTVNFASSVSMPVGQGFIAFALTPVPEPSTTALMVGGLCALFALRRRLHAQR